MKRDQPHERRRLRFSLRTAWMVISILAVVLGLIQLIPFQDLIDRYRYSPKERRLLQVLRDLESLEMQFPEEPPIVSLPDKEFWEQHRNKPDRSPGAP